MIPPVLAIWIVLTGLNIAWSADLSIGALLAVSGAVLSVIGALFNNLKLAHRTAMQIWMVSNVLLILWSAGYLLGWWNGGVSIGALLVMYCVYAVSNFYGLFWTRHT